MWLCVEHLALEQIQNPMTEVIQEQKLARLVEVGTRAWH